MTENRSYPEGVTSWIDIEAPDLDDAQAFYGGLFGWTFEEAQRSPGRYLLARLDGLDVAGLCEPGGPGTDPAAPAAWNTHVATATVEAASARVTSAGGRVLHGPTDAGTLGRYAGCLDPFGVPFRVWEAGDLPGAQLTNSPGSWNFSDLHAGDPAAAAAFYGDAFGWDHHDLGFATMITRPGYGDHLAATTDPGIHERQAAIEAPPGFADAIGWLATAAADERPHWHVSFTVADRDESVAAVERLGGTVLARTDSDWTRDALIRDPQGGVFTVSQFTPPE